MADLDLELADTLLLGLVAGGHARDYDLWEEPMSFNVRIDGEQFMSALGWREAAEAAARAVLGGS